MPTFSSGHLWWSHPIHLVQRWCPLKPLCGWKGWSGSCLRGIHSLIVYRPAESPLNDRVMEEVWATEPGRMNSALRHEILLRGGYNWGWIPGERGFPWKDRSSLNFQKKNKSNNENPGRHLLYCWQEPTQRNFTISLPSTINYQPNECGLLHSQQTHIIIQGNQNTGKAETIQLSRYAYNIHSQLPFQKYYFLCHPQQWK